MKPRMKIVAPPQPDFMYSKNKLEMSRKGTAPAILRPTPIDRPPKPDPAGQDAENQQRIIHHEQTQARSPALEDPQPAHRQHGGRTDLQRKPQDLRKPHESPQLLPHLRHPRKNQRTLKSQIQHLRKTSEVPLRSPPPAPHLLPAQQIPQEPEEQDCQKGNQPGRKRSHRPPPADLSRGVLIGRRGEGAKAVEQWEPGEEGSG